MKNDDNIDIDNYSWYGFNRTDIHRNAPKASDEVDILVRNRLSDQYNIAVVDQSYEGILGLRFEHRSTGSDFIVYSCFLPPENSAS